METEHHGAEQGDLGLETGNRGTAESKAHDKTQDPEKSPGWMEFVLRSLLYCSSKMRAVPWPELCPLWLCDMWGQNERDILLLGVTEPSQLPHCPFSKAAESSVCPSPPENHKQDRG